MKYFVTVGEQELELELGAGGVRFGDGGPLPAELVTAPGTPLRHLVLDGRGRRLAATRDEDGWTLLIDGRRLRVRVEDERTHAIRELAGLEGPGSGPRELRAPMPGLVVRVLVEPGQSVSRGDGMVVMEAMKMENELRADADGTVAEVRVEEGSTVAQDEVLVTLETGPDGDGDAAGGEA